MIGDMIHSFVLSEITRGILDVTPAMVGTIKEGIMEQLDERIGVFHVDITACQIRVRTLSLREFKACGGLLTWRMLSGLVSTLGYQKWDLRFSV